MSENLGFEFDPGSTAKVLVSHWALCGSDLRGLQSGRVFPGSLGHEVAGFLLSNGRSDELVSIFPIVPCFDCAVCSAGDWRNCPDRRTLGFELPGARSGLLSVDSRLIFKHSGRTPGSRACLTEHIACALHMASNAEVMALGQDSCVLIVGDGAMAFACASVLRWVNGANVRLVVKHLERLVLAESLGFEAELFAPGIYVSENVDVLILACDISGSCFRCAASKRPLLVSHVARQSSALGPECSRFTKLIDSFAYSPMEFSRAVELIDCAKFDLGYACVFDEPQISPDASVAFSQLRSLPRRVIKYVFKRDWK